MKYPIYENSHIKNLDNITEIKIISFKNIKEINKALNQGWIYLTVEISDNNLSLLLGRPKTKFPS